jgi:hypothetical protein
MLCGMFCVLHAVAYLERSFLVFVLVRKQIYLHDQNDAAFVSDVGFSVVPGQHSLVSVDYSTVRYVRKIMCVIRLANFQ